MRKKNMLVRKEKKRWSDRDEAVVNHGQSALSVIT